MPTSFRKLPVPVLSRLLKNPEDVLIRPLTTDDRAELDAMIARDPVAFLYAAEQLDRMGLPAPSALNAYRSPYGFMGVFEPVDDDIPLTPSPGHTNGQVASSVQEPAGAETTSSAQASLRQRLSRLTHGARARLLRSRMAPATAIPGTPEELQPVAGGHFTPSYRLVGAFWLGSNCVPLVINPEHIRAVATSMSRSARHIASIFGLQEEVLALWGLLRNRLDAPLSCRENQPLMVLAPTKNLGKLLRMPLEREALNVPQVVGNVRWARTSDRPSLLKASIAMFTEEIGYDPMTRDPRGYAMRVDEYVRTGRSLVATNHDGIVIFKADIGLAHADTCQLQGVWLHPAYRGVGLSAPLLAQACELIRPRFPRISLYVNDYNTRALALYRTVGFEQAGTFASILF